MTFAQMFQEATEGQSPYPYQSELAQRDWPDVLDVPTGLGKTSAVSLAWLWKRGWRKGGRLADCVSATPRRLVWCLPMRVLVEQTADNLRKWLENLGVRGNAGEGKVSVHVLMGGAGAVEDWAAHPEEDMILIGTQDMLLSRALMRGYGMSRYQWPIHFALLHNDVLWVYDEVQLMGAALPTSTQLEAFRRRFPLSRSSRSLWVSATLDRKWLDTVDFKPHLKTLAVLGLDDADRQQVGERLRAAKTVSKLDVRLTRDAGNKKGLETHLAALSCAILDAHDGVNQTLVIVNRVERAQKLFRLLREARPGKADLLIHSRFRAAERKAQTARLNDKAPIDRIVVATQAIEAGVDISSKVLVTELAPWSSLVQRFGRCNRSGEHNADGARILWIDVDDDKDLMLPYAVDALVGARDKLAALRDASPQALPHTDDARPLTTVLRSKDLLDLFNTDPDLSGFDVDVSDYIRANDRPGVQVFWRDFDDPNRGHVQRRPDRRELCPISIDQARDLHKHGAWRWDTLGDRWIKLDSRPRPGMTLLLKAADGGYDEQIGFDSELGRLPVTLVAIEDTMLESGFGDDRLSRQTRPIALSDHLGHVAKQAERLCAALGEATHANNIVRAGRWHDLGKAHAVFDATMHRCDNAPPGFLAKSPSTGRHSRKFFRHELVSMLAWLAQHDGEPDADLVAYLIAAHHGKVRMSLRAMPAEEPSPNGKRFARGVWEDDVLPALDFDGEHSIEITLNLAMMELGEGEQGPSWAERTLNLLQEHGPFRLAWLETLVRVADWRASRDEQVVAPSSEKDNQADELDNGHPSVAGAHARAAAGDPPPPAAAQSGAEHGLRGRAGGSANPGTGTRPPHAATRYLDTTLGVLSYAELAPHLARRVEALQDAIGEGEFDDHAIDETLFLAFHHRICAELTPAFAGRWRSTEVVVGTHEPPPPFQVAQRMREYVDDLNARIKSLPAEPDDLWLETLAFAEGRLLGVHPFTDFNGRVTRIFVDFLTRRLNLPDVDPTPDAGAATERYLDALRAADRHHWRPLMDIWRERLEQGVDA